MGFSGFHGNPQTVRRIREMLARGRFPHSVILSGPEGSGKYLLAQMTAKAMNCLSPPPGELPDFCGHCSNCEAIGQADDLDPRFREAVEAREALREADQKDTRILVQTHPEVLVIPPDPPQMMIKTGQVRRVIESIQYRPSQGARRVYIFTESSFMKEAANSLLKVLEEPPEFATIFLLAVNAGSLLPTIRSRSAQWMLYALPPAEVEEYLEKHRPELTFGQRALVARLSGGAIGKALRFDIAAYVAARKDAMVMLSSAIEAKDHSELFRTTESYRGGAEGKDRMSMLVRTLYSLLEDLLLLQSNLPAMIRNTDIQPQMASIASSVDFDWVSRASAALGRVESGMRRNLLRSVAWDDFSLSLESD